MLSEVIYRNPSAERVMGDKTRQVWVWFSWGWAGVEFAVRYQSLNANPRDQEL